MQQSVRTTLKRSARTALVALAALASLAFAAAPAGAAAGDAFLDECFSFAVVGPCSATGGASWTNAQDPEISPDGKHLYVATFSNGIRVFDRNASTNKLSPRGGVTGCYTTDGSGGACTASPSLAGTSTYDMDISPDGTSLYLAGASSVVLFQRDPNTGNLTPGTCYGSGAGCTPIAPIGAVYTVVVSKDGNNVYTRGGNTFGVLQRNPANGTLIPEPDGEDCFSEAGGGGCSDTYGMGGNAFEMDFSPDGKFLYYPIQSPGGIGFFQRSANGTLTQISGPQGGCITTTGASTNAGECATIPDGSGNAMSNAWSTAVSPDGKFAFVSGSSGTVAFSRSIDDGKLTKTDCVSPSAIAGCQQRFGSAGMDVAVSPDNRYAAVGSDDSAGVGVYDWNSTTGKFTQRPLPFGCFSAGNASCSSFPGGVQFGKVSWAPNSLNFYAAAFSSTVVNIVIDFPPTCEAKTATVPFQTSTTVPLTCSDPNNDGITLAISKQPAAGNLGAITDGTVRYNPFSGFSGPDSFEYTATARGVTSAPAKVTLNVQPAANNDLDKDGVSTPQDCNDTNPGIHPGAVDVPGNGVDEDCANGDAKKKIGSFVTYDYSFAGRSTMFTRMDAEKIPAGTTVTLKCATKRKGCPLKSKKIVVKKATKRLKLVKYLKKRKKLARLKKGAKISVFMTAPNQYGALATIVVGKSHKKPKYRLQCLAVGTTKTTACPS